MKRKQKEKKAKNKEPNLEHFLVHKLRRMSFSWPPRGAALKAARIERGQYKCASCEGIFGNKDIVLDHILPVVDPHEGFQTWDIFLNRLFCKEEGFQVLCRETCHYHKSQMENLIRKEVRKSKKPSNDGSDI